MMAYSAGLGETDGRYYDTAAPHGPLPHPLFAVCYEWPVAQPLRALPALAPLQPRLVHAEHDLTLHRLPRADETLQVCARIRALEPRPPGAFVQFRFEARDAAGEAVSTTDMGALYRGVQADEARGEVTPLPRLEAELQDVGNVAIAATAAHVYAECARIWNPIHTDVAYARRAGLPGIILHGTATLALTVARVLKASGVDAAHVRRVSCRFAGMVTVPATLHVRSAQCGRNLAFETRNAEGKPVITRGALALEDD